MMIFLKLFIVFFLLILLFAYLIPAGLVYGYLNHWSNKKWEYYRIQQRKFPSRKVMYGDIKWSMVTVFIFALMSAILNRLVHKGYGLMYDEIAEYGWIYFILSPFLAFLIHDFYFYWTHRLMHHPRIFKYVHLRHHKTITPTPWTIYSFQPLEAVIQYSGIFLLVFVMPLHSITLGIVIAYNIIANVGGHCGFDFTTPKTANHWFIKYVNTVTHHDMHHLNCRENYSLYFNLLDRLFKTYKEKPERTHTA